MSKMIQIRHVPDQLHRKLKVKAAKQGVSLSELMLRAARRAADELTIDEFLESVQQQEPVHLPISVVDLIREGRVRR